MESKKSYYVINNKDKKKKEVVYFQYDQTDCYNVKPKARVKDEIEVSKIVFVNPEFSEKIIRKKIDKRIAYLLKELNDDDGDEGSIRKLLVEAEKLRIQIINNYVKYLGHTYHSLTLEKIELIINELKYKLYMIENIKSNVYYNNLGYFDNVQEDNEKESRRGR